MKNFSPIYLQSGVVIALENNRIICRDDDDTVIFLTAGQQKLLKKLAENLNRLVSFDELYAAYASEDQQLTYVGTVNSNIAKMKRTFPNCIRSSITNTRNLGYTLEGSSAPLSEQTEQTETDSPVAELAGDYYGFYLNPLGNASLLNFYLCIRNTGTISYPQMEAYLISGIRDYNILLGDELPRIFSYDTTSALPRKPKEVFEDFRENLSENNKRCTFGEGTITCEANLLNIDLKMNRGTWKLLLDIEGYLKGHRRKKENKKDNEFYRGGFGLTLACATVDGTYAFRFGLFRKDPEKTDLMKNFLSTDHPELLEKLQIQDGSRDAEWRPLKLSKTLDKNWYDMIMKELY